jgi:hypothetical protein
MKTYTWLKIRTSSYHAGYRLVYEFEVENNHTTNTQRYTGESRISYE